MAKNCLDIKEFMPDYIEDELSEIEMNEVEDHVKGCKPCEKELAALSMTAQLLKSLPRFMAPTGMLSNVKKELKARRSLFQRVYPVLKWSVVGLGLAAILYMMIEFGATNPLFPLLAAKFSINTGRAGAEQSLAILSEKENPGRRTTVKNKTNKIDETSQPLPALELANTDRSITAPKNPSSLEEKKTNAGVYALTGGNCAVTEPTEQVFNSLAAWESFFQKTFPEKKYTGDINFKESMLVAVFIGERSSAGYSVNITDVVFGKTKITVKYEEVKPTGPAASVLTSPYAVFAVRKSDLPVEFIKQ
ncbi:MAG: protease complex subunit PrcB family protein [Candidatus Firestonebacteria bacterium]